MDKIIYTCSAEHIGFIFPKRKWWDFLGRPREARLEAEETFAGRKVRVLLRILENGIECDALQGMTEDAQRCDNKGRACDDETFSFHVYVPPVYREEIRREFIGRSCEKRQFEVLIVVDEDGTDLADMLMYVTEDVNYMAVFTMVPEQYEPVLERIEQESGLIGMIFTNRRDFKQYQKQICEKKSALVFLGNRNGQEHGKHQSGLFHLPSGSLVLDFNEQDYGQKMIWKKRMENDYVSMPIFLDNIIKNGYNSLVNEGLQTDTIQIWGLRQNVYRTDDKNKLSEKRKGIKKWKKRRIF